MSSVDRCREIAAKRERAEELAGEIRTLASHLHAGHAVLAEKLAEFDTLEGWDGFRSCADWLGLNAAMAGHHARQLVRVGHALSDLPLIRDAVRSGSVSFDAAAELVTVATTDDQRMWLDVAASATGPQLARICRASRRVLALESREHADDELRRRGVWTSYGDDGICTLRAVLAPDDMAVVVNALDRAARSMQERTPVADDSSVADPAPQPVSARWADALVAICADSRARDTSDLVADPTTLPMVVHVDVDALSSAASNARREIDGVTLPTSLVQKLACDTTIVALLEKDGSPLDVGRRHRIVPPKLRLAIQARDLTCRFPGCRVPARRCDADHIVSWLQGGDTNRANIASLCRFHHTRKHQGVFGYGGNADGRLEFTLANGRRIAVALPGVTPGGPVTDGLREVIGRDHSEIADTGGAPGYPSARMNLGYVVDVLLNGSIKPPGQPPPG